MLPETVRAHGAAVCGATLASIRSRGPEAFKLPQERLRATRSPHSLDVHGWSRGHRPLKVPWSRRQVSPLPQELTPGTPVPGPSSSGFLQPRELRPRLQRPDVGSKGQTPCLHL